MKKYEVGNWCFHDFRLVMVKRVEDGAVREVTTGVMCTSGSLRCVPLTVPNKLISDAFKSQSDKLHEMNSLNHPDIHRWMVDTWLGATEICDDAGRVRAVCDRMYEFCRKITEYVDGMKTPAVEGIRVFK